MKNKIEILAPAGSMESLIAAVRSGADAVYLGAKDFSARASAQNFTIDELREAVSYCKIRNVKVYLTVNTLMFDDELEKALILINEVYYAGIDAVIVQDIGLASLVKKHIPNLKLHGSTQMTIHTPAGAKALWEMGFSRVVLSRELSLKEIKEIADSCPIELEVFVHGALCMCVSGQCYFSAMLGSRSGNRGMCAQPCRLPFKLKGGSDYALSLKDNSLIDYLGELEKAGVASAKIEGRMKRPEYVSAASRACKEMRDTGFVTEETRHSLESVFSRTGFTDGYLKGKRTGEMFGNRRKEDVTASDEKLLSAIRNTYKDEPSKIPVDFTFSASLDETPYLIATDGTNTVTCISDKEAEKALNVAITEEKISTLLQKCGGTPYYANTINCFIDDNLSIPAGKINELRRNALEKLSCERSRVEVKSHSIPPIEFVPRNKISNKIATRARFADTDIPLEYKSCDIVFIPLFSSEEEFLRLKNEGFNVGAEINRGMFGKEQKIKDKLQKLKTIGIEDILCHNIGALHLAKELSFILHGGFGLNICNTASLEWAEDFGLVDTELSFELTASKINRLGGEIPRGIISYGYLPLMITRACPGHTLKGSCSSCKQDNFLQDRMNKSFIFRCDGICTEILNCVPLLISLQNNDFCNLDFHTLRFSVENSVEKVENPMSFSSNNLNSNKFTRGLYYRGVK